VRNLPVSGLGVNDFLRHAPGSQTFGRPQACVLGRVNPAAQRWTWPRADTRA
jgi:hypothetical protein